MGGRDLSEGQQTPTSLWARGQTGRTLVSLSSLGGGRELALTFTLSSLSTLAEGQTGGACWKTGTLTDSTQQTQTFNEELKHKILIRKVVLNVAKRLDYRELLFDHRCSMF